MRTIIENEIISVNVIIADSQYAASNLGKINNLWQHNLITTNNEKLQIYNLQIICILLQNPSTPMKTALTFIHPSASHSNNIIIWP